VLFRSSACPPLSTAVAGHGVVRKVLLPFVFLLCSPLFAQSGVWGSRGISRAFLVRDHLVYDVDGRGVTLYDVTNPAAIRRVAVAEGRAESLDGVFDDFGLLVLTRNGIDAYLTNLELRSQIDAPGYRHLRANGKYMVTASSDEVAVWDLSTLGMRNKIDFPGQQITSIALSGNALYVGIDRGSVEVFDLSGPRDIVYFPETANDMVIDGNRLYIAAGVQGLVVADISDPFAPRVIRQDGAGEINLTRVAVAGTKIAAIEPPSTVRLFDDHGLIGSVDDVVDTIAVDGTHLFVSGTNFDPFGLTTETGVPLRVYDIAAAPRVAGEVRDLAGPVSGAATDGTLAYVVDRPLFRVIDVSTTGAPRELASLSIPDIGDRVRLSGKQVIVYGRGDIDLVDVSDPYHPRLGKVFHSLGRPPSNAAFARNTILEGNPWTGFHVVDFVSYSDALQVGGIKGHYFDVVANGSDVAYVGHEGQAIAAVDLSDVNKPHFVKDTFVDVQQALLAGPRLVVRSVDGLHVYSLADPLNPTETMFIPMPGTGVAGAFGDAALVWSDNALMRVDLGTGDVTPTGLVAISPMQIESAGGKIVVADRYALRVFGPNTAPPPPPALLRKRATRP